MIIPQDQKLRITEYMKFKSTEQSPGPGKIEIERLVPMKISVVDGNGDPVEGVKLEVIDPGTQEVTVDLSVLDDRRSSARIWSSAPNWRAATMVFLDKTDAGGSCIVYGIKDHEGLLIRYSKGKNRHLEERVKFGGEKLSLKLRIE